jgi:hypothetical protein
VSSVSDPSDSVGPNAAVGNGSLVPVMEKTCDYIIRAMSKMQQERIKSMCESDSLKRTRTPHA